MAKKTNAKKRGVSKKAVKKKVVKPVIEIPKVSRLEEIAVTGKMKFNIGEYDNKRWYDNIPGKFVHDGKAYVVLEDKGKIWIWEQGEHHKKYDSLEHMSCNMSSGNVRGKYEKLNDRFFLFGDKVTYIGKDKKGVRVVKDRKEGPLSEKIGIMLGMEDGSLAYSRMRKDKKYVIHHEGKDSDIAFFDVESMFEMNGKIGAAVRLKSDEWAVYFDKKVGRVFNKGVRIVNTKLGSPIYIGMSSDGETLVDEFSHHFGPHPDIYEKTLTKIGGEWSFIVRLGNNKKRVVKGKTEYPVVDKIYDNGILMDCDGKPAYSVPGGLFNLGQRVMIGDRMTHYKSIKEAPGVIR